MLDSSFTKHYQTDTRLYNWIAKLNFQLNPNNSLVAAVHRPPVRRPRAPIFGGSNGADATAVSARSFENTHDASLHFVSKLADRRLQLDVIVGYHYDDLTNTPGAGGGSPAGATTRASSTSRSSRSRSSSRTSRPARSRRSDGDGRSTPARCRTTSTAAVGFLDHTTTQRISAAAAATYFARLGGTHALKLGFDFEDNIFSHRA